MKILTVYASKSPISTIVDCWNLEGMDMKEKEERKKGRNEEKERAEELEEEREKGRNEEKERAEELEEEREKGEE